VYGVSTVQEEIGLRGARTSAYGIDPQMAVVVEVGHTTDSPVGNVKRLGSLAIGKGPIINRGPNINPQLGSLLERVARKKKIPIQIAAEPRATSTDANPLQITRQGVATVLLRVPNRYMHTPVEVVSVKDIDQCSKLLAEFLMSIKGNMNLVPR
jgi:endoglucanase